MCRGEASMGEAHEEEEDEIEEGEISDDDDNSPYGNPVPDPINLLKCDTSPGKSAREPQPQRGNHEEKLRKVRELISSVTLQSACSCVEVTCVRLHDALVMIQEICPAAVTPGDALVTQMVGKLRIIFHVYNAIAQEQKSQVYPSLVKLGAFFSENFFTSSQSQELQLLWKSLAEEKPKENGKAQEAQVSEASYLPWEGTSSATTPSREGDIAPSYNVYFSSYPMDDLPSPTPSEEDVAARFGKTATTVKPTSQPPPQPPAVSNTNTSELVLKNRDPRRTLVSGVPNSGKPRIASILRKREPPENALVDVKRQRLNPGAEPSTGSGGWLDPDNAEEETIVPESTSQQVTMKPRDPRRMLVEDNVKNGLDSSPQTSTLVPEAKRVSKESEATDLASMCEPQGSAPRGSSNGSNDGEDLHPELQEFLEGLDENERADFQRERQRRMSEHEQMISEKKLCLVLDLDHTLLNSAKFSEIEPQWEQFLRAAEVMERSRERKELYRFPHMAMWTKLRPGIWRFLARACQLYEMHLYTMGNRAYATEMAKLLDPTGVMFAGRVISKGDEGVAVYGDEKLPKSKDLDGVLGMESAAIIIDDSLRVWPHHRGNLIVVERYMYFPSSRRQFGLPGPSLLEVGHDEREADGMLSSVLAVIERIHYTFFVQPIPKEADVREILALEQQSILKGCKIVFSRIFPVGEMQPQLYPLWRLAEQFGAVCTTAIEEDVTHVVATAMGTDKVNWALGTGRHLVRPAWLEASTILYRRANERDFPVPT